MRSKRLMNPSRRRAYPAVGAAKAVCALLLLVMLHVVGASHAAGEMQWSPAPCGIYPPLLEQAEMLYDKDTQRFRFFGGDFNVAYECTLDGHWTSKKVTTYPEWRGGFGCAYDSVRKRHVIFGGQSGISYFNDTWEWDGDNWTRLNPALSPEARTDQAMAYDPKRQRSILFGGYSYDRVNSRERYYNDTWEWNGTDWKKLTPAQSPPTQSNARLIYDPQRDRMVLYGGTSPWPQPTNETWEWDGGNWIKCAPAQTPPARLSPAMVYDDQRQRVLLQGGKTYIPQALFQDTWEWDGTNWTQRTPATAPLPGEGIMVHASGTGKTFYTVGMINWWVWDGEQWKETWLGDAPLGRMMSAMAYDSDRKRVVLFGGSGKNNRHLQDTWEWDGARWTECFSKNSPPVRGDHAMAYDAARKRVILFGGHPQDSTLSLGDTWAWDGVNWTQLKPAQSPPAHYGHAMAYDANRQRIVLFSAAAGTWEWDGSNWKNCAPKTQPSTSGLMAYDGARKKTLLLNPNGMIMHAWDGTNWEQIAMGAGPAARSDTAMACDSATGRIILFGGRTSSYPDPPARDTWLWDGGRWTRLSTPGSMAPREKHMMIFDGQNHLLFGGNNPSTIYMQETWLMRPTAPVGAWEAFE